MKFRKKGWTLLLCGMLALSLCGCGSDRAPVVKKDGTYVFDLEEAGNSLYPVEYEIKSTETTDQVKELMDQLAAVPEDEDDYRCVLPEGVTISSCDVSTKDELVTIDFSKSYREMEKTREVLARAAFVRTLLQINGISQVAFTIDGEPAVDADGNVIGVMNSDTFIENAKQINAYQNVAIDLYFADETGTMLNIETRSIYYSSSKPLEWAIVERLIAGPKSEGNKAAISSSTQILSVTNADDICYVNLSKAFITDALDVKEEIPIYSIVDSICYNCKGIKKGQVSVEGDSDVTSDSRCR